MVVVTGVVVVALVEALVFLVDALVALVVASVTIGSSKTTSTSSGGAVTTGPAMETGKVEPSKVTVLPTESFADVTSTMMFPLAPGSPIAVNLRVAYVPLL